MSTQANAISNARQHMSALHQIGYILGEINDFEDALNQILKAVCEGLNMSLATVSLLHEETDQLSIDIAYGLSKSEIERGRYKVGEGITGKVVESGKPVIVPRISSEPLFLNRTGAGEERANLFYLRAITLSQKVVGNQRRYPL